MTVSNPRKGILRDSMELWRVYRFARFVRKKTKENKNYALESFLMTRFIQTKHKWWIKRFALDEVRRIIDYARKNEKQYLGQYSGDGGVKLKVSLPHGQKLLDFPLGTLQTILEEYGVALSLIASALIAIAGQWHNIVKLIHIGG